MTTEAQSHLQALGFTEYEARAYIALLQQGSMSGYQVAKASGIPRPNIYPVLDRLQQRGAAVKIDVKGGVAYCPTPPDALLQRLSQTVKAHLGAAGGALQGLMSSTPVEFIRNAQGYENVMAKAEALVDSAQSRLLVGICAAESKYLSAAWERATARGVPPVILCVQGCAQPCGHCEGQVYRYGLGENAECRWLILVVDNRELLAAQVSPNGQAVAACTGAEVVVGMATHFLRNTIAAAEIVRNLGPRLAEMVDPTTLEALEGGGLAPMEGRSWLKWAISTAKRSSD